MSKVIESWVYNKVGIYLNLAKEEIAEELYDGVIFYELVNGCTWAHNNLQRPKAKVNDKVALSNLCKLGPWLKILGVTHDYDFLKEIASKKKSQCLRLLFELYLKLEDKDNIYMVTKQREAYFLSKPKGRFDVIPCDEPKIVYLKENENENLELPLLRNRDLIFHYKKIKKLAKDQSRKEALDRKQRILFESKLTRPHNKLTTQSLVQPSNKVHLAKKINDYMEELTFRKGGKSDLVSCSGSDQIGYLKQKRKKTLANEMLKLKMQTLILHDLWISLLQRQEREIEDVFYDKLLHQSMYEKQLSLRILRSHSTFKAFSNQKSVIAEKLDEAQNILASVKVNNKEDNDEIRLEKNRLTELYNRLKEKRKFEIKKSLLEICENIVYDFVNYAICVSEYYQLNGLIPQRVLNNWKNLFYKGYKVCASVQSKLSVLPEFGDIYFEHEHEQGMSFEEEVSPSGFPDDYTHLTAEYNKKLVECNVENYVNLRDEWELPRFSELANDQEKLNIIGFVVHRLLNSKYPFIESPKPPVLPNFNTKMVLGNSKDSYLIYQLKGMLKNTSIAVVDVNIATNYCLNVYNMEKKLSEFAPNLKEWDSDTNSNEPVPVEIVDESLIERRPKEEEDEIEIDTFRKSQSPQKSGSSKVKKPKIPIKKKNKKIQCPSMLTIPKQPIEHSYCGLLGKMAFESLNLGKSLNNVLIVKMIIEYLKSLTDKKGFVLVGYPMTYNQAALLEFLLSGKQVPYHEHNYDSIDFFPRNLSNVPTPINGMVLIDFDNLLLKYRKVKPIETSFGEECFVEEEEEEEQEEIDQTSEYSYKSTSEFKDDRMKNPPPKTISKRRRSQKKKVTGKKRSPSMKRNKKEKPKTKGGTPMAESPPRVLMSFESTDDIVDTLNIKKHLSSQLLQQLRLSKILPNPMPYESVQPKVTQSYFSHCLTVVKQMNKKDKKVSIDSTKSDNSKDETTKEKLLQEKCLKNINNSLGQCNLLPEDFFSNFGIVKKFRFHTIDSRSVLSLANFILKREEQFSEAEFTSEVTGKETFKYFDLRNELLSKKPGLISENIALIPIIPKDKVVTREYLKSEQSEFPDEEQAQETTCNVEQPRETTTTSNQLSAEINEIKLPVKILPGEPGWNYMRESVSENLEIALATLWEKVEKGYLENLHNCFSMLNTYNARIIPYRNLILQVKNECLDRQDERLNIVNNFQLMFNAIDDEFRMESIMKEELHSRVEEMRKILIELANAKRTMSNSIRNKYILRSWLTNHVYQTANCYINMMQLELDRFVDSIQILNDYYTDMLKGMPEERAFPKFTLKKVSPTDNESVHSFSLSNSKRKKGSIQPGHNHKQHGHSSSVEIESISFEDKSESAVNPSQVLLNPGANSTMSRMKSIQLMCKTIIKNESMGKELRIALMTPKKDLRKRKGSSPGSSGKGSGRRASRRRASSRRASSRRSSSRRTSKRRASQKRKTRLGEKENKIKRMKLATIINAMSKEGEKERDEDIVDIIKQEWETAIQNEIDRGNLRIQLIMNKGVKDIDEVLDMIINAFQVFDLDVEAKHVRELDAINNVCKVFQAAIEDCCPIQPLLVLDLDHFYIDTSNLLFANKPPEVPLPIEEPSLEFGFRIKQLDNFASKMTHLAPNGIIEEAFISILESFGSDESHQFTSRAWSKLTREEIKTVVLQAFGDTAVVDWRDFVIFSANIPYPTIEELLQLQKTYHQVDTDRTETITYSQFDDIPLWFDKDFGETIAEDLRLALAKELIFKIFQVNIKEINYTNMLLGFCKSPESIDGFLKALKLLTYKGYLKEDEKCNIIPPKVEGLKVVTDILHKTHEETMDRIEGIIVKRLPKHYNEFIYASMSDEYIETEKILANNNEILKNESSEDSLADERDTHKYTYTDNGIAMSHLEKFTDPMWHICVPYDMVLSLIIIALHLYALSPNHFNRQLEIENRLKELYKAKGTGDLIKAFLLVESDVMDDVFKQTAFFKTYNINRSVEELLNARQTVVK